MAEKCILLGVAEPQLLLDITQALGPGWEVFSVAAEPEALAELEKRSFDAFLVDFNLGDPDASDLLNHVLEKHPETARFLLAYEADLALIAAKVTGTLQILPKPIEPDSLRSRIENAVTQEALTPSETESETPPDTGAGPTVSPVYAEVLKAIESTEVTNEQIAELIAQDTAFTGELLRLTDSAYLGLPRNLTEPAQAVDALGVETVKALAMALRFLAEHSHLRPGYLSFEQVWEHSVRVGQLARDLVLFETKDRSLAAQALIAGFLHDLGKVVLVTNFDDLYGRVHSLAQKQPIPLWAVEKEMFGANHGEIGGCLVGMWNMPGPIVDAVALHHEPPLGEQQQLTPLAAVHIANVLEHERRPSAEFRVAPEISTAFLSELGLLQRLPIWRAAFANRSPAAAQPALAALEAQAAQAVPAPSRTGNQIGGPAAATHTGTSGSPDSERQLPPARPIWQRQSVQTGVAAGVLILLVLWLGTQLDINQPVPVAARAPYTSESAVSLVSNLPPVSTPEPTPPAVAVATAPEAAPQTNALPKAAPAQPPPAPAPVVVAQPAVTHTPAPTVASKSSTQPEFRLSGIIYTVPRPSAMVNGKTVFVGDRIDGATVISIEPDDVTLQINGRRKTFELR